MQVVSFVDYVPAARFDALAWQTARIEEGATTTGPWSEIDSKTLDPVDTDPARPQSRSLTTANASDTQGLWYRIVWIDAALAESPTLPVQNVTAATLSPLALCSDEDVRMYLGVKDGELSEDDRNTIIRLVNAASETYTDESQRLWKAPLQGEGVNSTRLYRLDSFDASAGRIRIDDCTTVSGVGMGAFRDPLGPAPIVGGWWGWQEEPDYPITAIVFGSDVSGLSDLGSGPPVSLASAITALRADYIVSVDAQWGWPRIPEKVRQDVIYTAAEWYARDVEKFSATFSIDQGRILMPQVLPSQVQRSAESYRRWRVA